MKRTNIKKNENINSITNDAEFYKLIFDSSLHNKVIVENGIIIEINDKALENISSSKENVIGKKLSYYFPLLQPDGEQSLKKSRRIFKQVVQNKINLFRWNLLNPPNTNFEIEVNLNYIKYNKRKFFVYNFFFVQNNTNLLEKEIVKNKELESLVKQLQEVIIQKYDTQTELTNSQRVVRSIINSSIDIIIATDENGFISEFNNAAQNVFGYKKEEVIGKSVAMLYAGPEEKIKVNNALNETGFFSGEILNKRKDGEIFTSYLSLSEMVNETNSFIGRVGVSRDVTVEKIQQQKLIDSEERYREIVENTSDIIFSFTVDGKFIFSNNSFLKSLGYSLQELENTTINQIIHPESLATFNQEVKKIVVSSKQINLELPFVKKDRKLLIAQGILSCKKNEKNDIVFLASFKNISEQKLSE